jgi:hypothetical protein
MSKFGQAVTAFFDVLKNGAPVAAPEVSQEPASARSDALTLLAALQREARLVDFLMEPLDECSDQQVGAAVRDIQKDSRSVLVRMFELEPLRNEPEGTTLSVPAGFDSGEFKLTGNIAGEAPYQGELMHAGWRASRTDIPSWNGAPESASIMAPAEVEIR